MSYGRRYFRGRRGSRDANHSQIANGLRKLGYFFVDCSGLGGGALDLLVYDRLSNAYWVELKTDDGKLSDSQLDFIGELETRGISWGCCRTLDDVLMLVGHSDMAVAR